MSEEQIAADSGATDGGDVEIGLDISAASDTLADSLFPRSDDDEPRDDDGKAEPELVADEPHQDEPAAPQQQAVAAPQSWKKEMHEKFAALPPDVQEYIGQREQQMKDGLEKDRGDANLGRVMRDTMAPYKAMLQAQGVDEPRAVQALLNAHYKLTNSDPQTKAHYFAHLAQQYGIDPAGLAAGLPAQQQMDPAFKALQDRLNGIEHSISASHQAAIENARVRVVSEVDAFASDPAHPYFDEVSGEIVAMIQAGHELKDAYEKAVWANPVTRQKEIARLQTEQATQLRKKAEDEAKAARSAAAANVRSRDTRRTPTGPKGTMKDLDGAMREAMAEIKSRTH